MTTWFNFIEAFFWMGLGVGFLVSTVTRRLPRQGIYVFMGVLLILFGISDFFEMASGAWWRPPWLLIYKGTCLAGLLAAGVWLWVRRYKKRS